jgi:hypothetical protein
LPAARARHRAGRAIGPDAADAAICTRVAGAGMCAPPITLTLAHTALAAACVMTPVYNPCALPSHGHSLSPTSTPNVDSKEASTLQADSKRASVAALPFSALGT